MTVRSTNGTRWSDPIETVPAPTAAAVETDWSGWQHWLDSYLNIERKKARDTFAEVYEALGNACIELHDEIERVEQQVAELVGAVSVLKGLGPPPGIRFRGDYDASTDYSIHDIVAKNGSSFVALRDRPGVCPGEHWQLLAGKGDRGRAGPSGPCGMTCDRGEPAPLVKGWLINKTEFTVAPVLSSGEVGVALELRALFQEFLDQTRAGG
jgi:hypothetical protein